MSTTSPLPGLVRISTPHLVPKASSPPGPVARWLVRSVAPEIEDTSGRIAITTSAVAAVITLGHLFGAGLFGIFPYQYARLVVYGASFLSGSIIAAGFLSETRTARFAATLTTTIIAAFALADQLQVPGWASYAIKIVYGVGLVAAVSVAVLRAVRRRISAGRD